MDTAGAALIGTQRPRLWTAPDRHRELTEGCPSCGDPEYKGAGCGDYLSTDVLAWAQGFGYELDDWQQWVLTEGLGTKPDGRWASFENAVILSRQNGKNPEALSNEVCTQRGWVTFADIRPGDEVLGSDGRFTAVVAVSPVYQDEPCYAVTFTDGARIVVGHDHLWHVQHKARKYWQNVPTSELAGSVGGKRPGNGRMEYNWRVRCDTVPEFPEADLPVDPYLLGYWLGDGTTGQATLTVGWEDRDWVCARLYRAGCVKSGWEGADEPPVPKSRQGGSAFTVGLRLRGARMRDGLESRLRKLGIWGSKRIPEAYLTASVAQRKALLAGLMDSDGSITCNNRTPQAELSTSFPALAGGIHRLLRSLGIRVTPVTRVPVCNGKPGALSTRFLFTALFCPFEMPRKAERWQPPASQRHELMSITAIEPAPSVPVRCITVASPDGVYLTGRLFTPTHNCILEIRELAGLFVIGESLIIHTSHEFKALDTETPVLTANRGWATMGDLTSADLVYAPDGTAVPLIAHPWRTGRPCYRLTFADGQAVIADAEHLWDVTEVSRWNGRTARRVVTTQEMFDAGCTYENKPQAGAGRVRRVHRWRVDLPQPVQRPEAQLPVPPWLFGAWLGDGTSASGCLTVGEADLEFMQEQVAACGEKVLSAREKRPGVWTVRLTGLTTRLRELGVLRDKHIPEAYALASEQQRRELLTGIMDTDGTVSGHQLAVTMVREDLMRQVLELVRSLGYKATLREFRARLNGTDAGPMWRVQFAPNGHTPFSMPRKTRAIRQLRTTRSAYNAIVAIEPVSTRPTRCITVDHPSGCYLAGRGFAVTHNTSQEHFRRVRATVENYDALRRRLKGKPIMSHGDEAIELLPVPTLIFGSGSRRIRRKVGSRLRFLARSRGSGRGFTSDCLIYDEAMILSAEQIGASLPTMAAVPNPQVWYMGSAGMPDSDQLGAVRRRIVRNSRTLFGAEWSARLHTPACPRDERRGRAANDYVVDCTEHDDRDDPATWARVNPAYGIRLREEFIANELDSMPPVEFNRERLGVGQWPSEEEAWGVISEDAWSALAIADAGGTTPPIAFAVDASEDGEATIGAAWAHRDGKIVIEVPRGCSRPGTSWLVPRLKELVREWKPAVVVVPKNGPAAGLGDDIEAAFPGRVLRPGSADEAAAFAWFTQQVKAPGHPLAHFGKVKAGRLWKAVGSAETRVVGDGGKTWRRRDSDTDITPVTTVTLASWGLNKNRRGYDPLRSIG